MCLNYLDVEGRGVTCPNPECGLENGKEASFCKYCGTALVEEEVAIPGIVETALTISNALTGGISDEFEEQEEMSEEDAAAFEEFKREQAEMRGETLEDEGEELAPPSALDLEQEAEQELTPPPPAEEELAFDEEPPAPVAAEEELAFDEEPVAAGVEPAVGVEAAISPSDRAVAAPLPEGELSEEDLIPPIPDDLPGFDDEVTTPSVAGTAAVADEIEAPAFVLCGTQDRMTPVKYATFLRDQIYGATLTLVEGAGHMVMLEQPQAVTKALGAFLEPR